MDADYWRAWRGRNLLPRLKAAPWAPMNPGVPLEHYFPRMEAWLQRGEAAFRAGDWLGAWTACARTADYVLAELRRHPQWRQTAATDRMVRVVAERSVRYAEESEKHLRNMLRLKLEREAQAKAAAEARAKAELEARAKAELEARAKAELLEAQAAAESTAAFDEARNTTQQWSTSVVFFVNGKRVEISPDDGLDPSMRLVDYLRNNLGLHGTKVGCGEGGCGSCSVLLSFDDDDNNNNNNNNSPNSASHRIVNACLRPLAACDGASITTVEGIGAQGSGTTMHPVQQRLAQCDGSQCGFCSPGWVMNGFAMLMNNPTPTDVQAVQDRFDGNLCRCTGFRAILKAMSSFVPGGDGGGGGGGEAKDATAHELAPYNAAAQSALRDQPLPEEVRSAARRAKGPLRFHAAAASWVAPTSLADLEAAVTSLVTAGSPFDFVLGGTARGVAKYYDGSVESAPGSSRAAAQTLTSSWWPGRRQRRRHTHAAPSTTPTTRLSTFHVTELQGLDIKSDGTIVAGSAVTLTALIRALESTGDDGHAQLARHVSRVANLQVRNVGGWAGNLTLAKRFPTFPSDVLTVMSAAGASLQLKRWLSKPVAPPTTLSLSVSAWIMDTPVGSTAAGPAAPPSFYDLLVQLTIPPLSVRSTATAKHQSRARVSFSSFKLARRQQNAHALINMAACLSVMPAGAAAAAAAAAASSDVIGSASIFLHGAPDPTAGGSDAAACGLVHATRTTDALVGKTLGAQATLDGALAALRQDLGDGVPAYALATAQALLYKALLAAQPALPPALASAANWQLPRGVSTGTEVWSPPPATGAGTEAPPAGAGMPKIRATLQCTGQAKYASDFYVKTKGLLHAAPVLSTRACARLASVDPSVAYASATGVVDVITADDVGADGNGGVNNCGADVDDNAGVDSSEPIFVPTDGSGVVYCVGQCIALVVADTAEAARTAARAMMDPATGGVVYAGTDDADAAASAAPLPAPILSIDDAIAKNSFYQGSHAAVLERLAPGVSTIDAALAAAPHTWKGTLRVGAQRHFYMETQRCIVTNAEDGGLRVRSSTQGVAVVSKYVSRATGVPMHAVVTEQVRAGGAFGGKLTRNLPIACAAAVAARKLKADYTGVAYVLDRVDDQQTTGAREPMRMDVQVGFEDDGTLTAFRVNHFMDGGWTLDSTFQDLDMATRWTDNAYFVPNFQVVSKACKTNTPSTTSMRAPGVLHAVMAIEHAIEAGVCPAVGMDRDAVRAKNFYRVGDAVPTGQKIKYVSLPKCWAQVQSGTGDTPGDGKNYAQLKAEVAAFNAQNRWVKRAVSLLPCKYGIGWDSTFSGATVSVYAPDGTVVVSHGGAELGQGLFTKVAQACAAALGLGAEGLSLVRTAPTSSRSVPNNGMTGGSSTSEVTCQAVMNACAVLVKRLAPYRDPVSKGGKGLSWKDAVHAAGGDRVQLSAQGWFAPPDAVAGLDFSWKYFVWAAGLSVVELDALTGQAQILRTDIVYDCGQSLNPVIDIGQIEGGFVMGIGSWMTEEARADDARGAASTGRLLSNGTWDYKPPCSKDIPLEFNVALLKDNPNVAGILGSKATAEPPMILSSTVFLALRRCVEEARLARGLGASAAADFDLHAPATAERLLAAIANDPDKDFVL